MKRTRESILLNRELAYLDCNRHLLARAEDRRLPLLERVKFVAIASGNLDEFFQLRIALLHARLEAGLDAPTANGRSYGDLLSEIRERVLSLVRAEQDVSGELRTRLEDAGIRLASWTDISRLDRKVLRSTFDERIFPLLTPLAVDAAHPFPCVSNLRLNLAVEARPLCAGNVRFAHINVPPMLERFLPLESGEGFIPIEKVIAAHLEILFRGMEIQSHSPFRVTRRADHAFEEDDAEDRMAAIESGVHWLNRRTAAVRLEIEQSMSRSSREFLMHELDLDDEDVYPRRDLLDLRSLVRVGLAHLKRRHTIRPSTAPTPRRLAVPASDSTHSRCA